MIQTQVHTYDYYLSLEHQIFRNACENQPRFLIPGITSSSVFNRHSVVEGQLHVKRGLYESVVAKQIWK